MHARELTHLNLYSVERRRFRGNMTEAFRVIERTTVVDLTTCSDKLPRTSRAAMARKLVECARKRFLQQGAWGLGQALIKIVSAGCANAPKGFNRWAETRIIPGIRKLARRALQSISSVDVTK